MVRAQTADLSTAYTENADGSFTHTETGAQLPAPGIYEMTIIDVEEGETNGKFGPGLYARVAVTIDGTEQSEGEYKGEPMRASLFVNSSPKKNFIYVHQGKTKVAAAGAFIESMGIEIPNKRVKFDKVEWTALIGGHLKGFVDLDPNGKEYPKLRITADRDDPSTYTKILMPVTNKEHLAENAELAKDFFGV